MRHLKFFLLLGVVGLIAMAVYKPTLPKVPGTTQTTSGQETQQGSSACTNLVLPQATKEELISTHSAHGGATLSGTLFYGRCGTDYYALNFSSANAEVFTKASAEDSWEDLGASTNVCTGGLPNPLAHIWGLCPTEGN